MSILTILAQVSDLHLDDTFSGYHGVDTRGNFMSILDAIEERGISNLVLTGDLGQPGSQRWLLDAIASHNMNPLFLLGNHDRLGDFKNVDSVSDHVKPDGLYYSLMFGSLTCFFLDSSTGSINHKQRSWLEEELMKATGDVAIFVHHPVLDCGHTAMDRLYPLKNRTQIQEVLELTGRDISVFCGHYHTTHEQKAGKISQYVTPSTALQLKQFSDKIEMESTQIGYRTIEFSTDKIWTEVVTVK